MSAAILSFPFRLTPGGSIATVDQNSEAADAEQIAVLIATRQGERELNPGFGIPDPVGRGFQPSSLIAGLATYGPPVTVKQVTVTNTTDGMQRVNVEF